MDQLNTEEEKIEFKPISKRCISKRELPNFPIECLPKVMRDYAIAVSVSTLTPVEMAATMELGVASGISLKKYYVQGKKGHIEQESLYTLVVANPAEGKSPVYKYVTKPVERYEEELNKRMEETIFERNALRQKLFTRKERLEYKIKKSDKKYDKQVEEWEREIYEISKTLEENPEFHLQQLYTSDATLAALADTMEQNNSKMIIMSSEGNFFNVISMKKNQDGNGLGLVLNGYNGETTKEFRITRGNKTIREPELAIVEAVQPNLFESILEDKVFSQTGFWARFLFCFPKSKIADRVDYFTDDISENVQCAYEAFIHEMLEIEDKKRILEFEEIAKNEISECYKKINQYIQEDDVGMSDWLGKMMGTVFRIAGIIHVAEEKKGRIKLEELQRAETIVEYYRLNARYAYSKIPKDDSAYWKNIMIEKVVDDLTRNPSEQNMITFSRIKRICRVGKLTDEEKLIETIETLIRENYLIKSQKLREAEANLGARSKGIYYVNPQLLEEQ